VVLLIGYPSLDVNSNAVLGVHVLSILFTWQKCYTSLYSKSFKKFWISLSCITLNYIWYECIRYAVNDLW
jgi:hypothetical protein